MSVKHSIEEIFDLKDPYIPSESVIDHKEELKMSLKELEEDREMSDIVNKPPHYISGNGIETIDVIEAFTKDLEPFEAYCTGNIIKYICRWKHKNGLEDLKKARWYINKMLKDGEDVVEIPKFNFTYLKYYYPFNNEWDQIDGIYNMRSKDDYLFVMLSDDECLGKHNVDLPDGSKYLIELKRTINDERSS